MAVLSLVVTEKVPHSSEEVPLLGQSPSPPPLLLLLLHPAISVVYFHFNMVVVTIATVLTSTVMRVHIKGFHYDRAPPRWMCRVLFLQEKRPAAEDKHELGAGFLHRHVVSEQWGEVSPGQPSRAGSLDLAADGLSAHVLVPGRGHHAYSIPVLIVSKYGPGRRRRVKKHSSINIFTSFTSLAFGPGVARS